MAEIRNATRGAFHAAIQEVQPGVFRAQYRGELNPEHPDEGEFPDCPIGTSVDGVKIWTQQMARTMGYERVVWDALPQ